MNEIRNFNTEFRFDKETNRIVGEAIVFNSESRDLGGFIETISKDALREANMDDIVLLFNHDTNQVLGRSTPDKSSFSYNINERGVSIDIQMPDTTLGRDLSVLIERGDINQMSFAFRIAEGGDQWEQRDGGYFRNISKIDMVSDFSFVTRAAYPDTSIAVRSLDEFKDKIEKDDIEEEFIPNLQLSLDLRKMKAGYTDFHKKK